MTIEITSSAFSSGSEIPERFTCVGEDSMPPIQWSGIPDDTAEQALVVEDPDAPGGTFVRLMLVGIPADVDRIEDVSFPTGAIPGKNGFDEVGWRGPCPPEGDEPHRYIFRILALRGRTGLADGFTRQEFHDAVQGLETARGELEGRFGRG